jgi:hypothetical protein
MGYPSLSPNKPPQKSRTAMNLGNSVQLTDKLRTWGLWYARPMGRESKSFIFQSIVLTLGFSVACVGCDDHLAADPCGPGMHDEAGQCVSTCGEGTRLENGVCNLLCEPGEHAQNGLCVPNCAEGTQNEGGVCAPDADSPMNDADRSEGGDADRSEGGDAGRSESGDAGSETSGDGPDSQTADIPTLKDAAITGDMLTGELTAPEPDGQPSSEIGPVADGDSGPMPEKTLEGTHLIMNSLDAEALYGYTKITGNLIVLAQGLTSLSLPTLKEVDGFVAVTENSGLTSFTFSALTRVGKYLYVYNNDALSSLFLPALESVGGDLWVNSNATLTSFRIPKLMDVAGQFRVFSSSSLTFLELPALATLGAGLSVESNNALSTFDLSALSQVGGYFYMHNNHSLPQCLVDALVTQVEAAQGIGGGIEIDYNLSDCTCHEVDGVMKVTCL